MTYFKKLLNKVFDGTETKEEYQELLRLYESGEYDDELTSEDLKRISLRYQPQESGAGEKIVSNAHDNLLSRIGDERGSVQFYKSKVWLAAAAIVVITMVAGVWFIVNERDWFNSNLAEQNEPSWTTYSGKQVVMLADGTEVVLNENSELTYARPFGGDTREVMLKGEATFDVTHDHSKPFLVRTGKVTTKVLGTEFNVKAYTDQGQVTITVLRGLVEVRSEDRILGQIRPNEQIAFNTKSNEFVQQQTNAQGAIQWKSNFLILQETTIEDAILLIGEKYKTKVVVTNKAMLKCKINASFLNDENLEQVIKVVSGVLEATYSITEDEVKIEGGRSCKVE